MPLSHPWLKTPSPWLKTHGPLSSVPLLSAIAQVYALSPHIMLPLCVMAGRWSNVVAVLLCFHFLNTA
jgi:hypothetical protein